VVAIGAAKVTADNVILTTNEQMFITADKLIFSTKSQVVNNSLYRANTSITLGNDLNIRNKVNVILNSGGAISFNKGFKIVTGAQLTCKTGHF
jgi:hypothetical protein